MKICTALLYMFLSAIAIVWGKIFIKIYNAIIIVFPKN